MTPFATAASMTTTLTIADSTRRNQNHMHGVTMSAERDGRDETLATGADRRL
jgi:hypothetical protein